MEKRKKKNLPDSIVFDPDKNIYDSFLKTYSTNISGPKIDIPDVALFKANSLAKANHKFSKRAEEIKEQIESLFQEFSDNEMIWDSKLSFEPNVGSEIYVYIKENGEKFCSLISPDEWGKKYNFLGHFKLDTDFSWRRINKSNR
jgi:hypothetical protein